MYFISIGVLISISDGHKMACCSSDVCMNFLLSNIVIPGIRFRNCLCFMECIDCNFHWDIKEKLDGN